MAIEVTPKESWMTPMEIGKETTRASLHAWDTTWSVRKDITWGISMLNIHKGEYSFVYGVDIWKAIKMLK